MKAIKRKLLSLLLAMAMVLTLAPTALADGLATATATPNTTTSKVDLSATLPKNATDTGDTVEWSWTMTGSGGSSVTLATTASASLGYGGETDNFAYGQSYTLTATATVKDSDGQVKKTYTKTASLSVPAAPNPPSSDPVASSIVLSPNEVTISASATSAQAVSAAVKDAAGKTDGLTTVGLTVKKTAGTTATARASGHTILIDRDGTGGGDTTFEVSVTDKPDVKATLTVHVTAQGSSSGSTVSIATGGVSKLAVNSTLTASVYAVTPDLGIDGYDRITWTSGNSGVLSVATVGYTPTSATFTGVSSGSATVTVIYTKNSVEVARGSVTIQVGSTGAYLTGTPVSGSTVALDNWYNYDNTVRSHTFSVVPSISGVSQTQLNSDYTVSYVWYLSNSVNGQRTPLTTVSSSTYTLYSNNQNLYYNNGGYVNNVLTCEATFRLKNSLTTAYTATAYWYIGNNYYNGNVFASATIYRSSGSYSLGGVDDAGKSSIVSQLDNYFYNYNTALFQYGYGLAYVQFVNTTDSVTGSSLSAAAGTSYYVNSRSAAGAYALSNVLFYPGSTIGTATFRIRAYYYTSSTYNTTAYVEGAITFAVTGSTYTGDITYSGSIGSDVAFALRDFEDYYYKKTTGTLSYVTFSVPSGGSLYSDGGRLLSSNACYVSPGLNQTDLAGVYFSPSGTTASRAGTVTINFTAYGNRSSTAGTVVITYLAGSASDITYNIYTSGTLNPADFTNAYRQVVGSAAPTGLTIEFQSVPTYGSLSYKDSSRSNSTVVALRSTNIKSYRFTTLSTGTNQLGDVTYTASGNRTDTIGYTAYVNNTPQFTGKVVFNGSNTSAANMQVGFTSTNGQGVAFSYAEFSKANAAVIAMTSYIRFMTLPTNGTLTYNGAVLNLSSTNISPAMLSSVVYRPTAGFNNGTDRVSFLCYDANGNSVGGGQVSIVVTGNISNGANSIYQFKDVSATAWYRDDLSRLVNAGIIKGKGDGKFDPTAELTYGEALKIFMLASGYPAQQEPSGKNWAINYKTQAVSNGWISDSVDLNAKISRNAMAELVAKSLGVSPTDSVPPTWRDGTSNSYSNALYYTNPQILIGNADGTFKGTSTLKRQEICAIASRVLTYKNNQQASVVPGWIG